MLRETGCAGASVARGALGAPWIFRQALDLAARGTYDPPAPAERHAAFLAHLDGLVGEFGEEAGARAMRRAGFHYTRGLPDAAALRAAIQAARTPDALRRAADAFLRPDK
jgi:tRNA-dihydrouridine synthase